MNRFSMSCLLSMVLLFVTTVVDAEGDGPRARARLSQIKAQAEARTEIKRRLGLLKALVPDACPQGEAAWLDWRDRKIGELLELKTKANSPGEDVPEPYLLSSDVMERSTKIKQELLACSKPASDLPTAGLGNFIHFIDAHSNADFNNDLKHQFGHGPEDKDFLQLARRQLELPCLLRSRTFLRYMSKPATYRDAWDLVRLHNDPAIANEVGCQPDGKEWTTLIYRSNFLPTPDYAETFGRFFVLVKDDKDPANPLAPAYDKWIQFGIWLPEDEKKRPEAYGTVIHNVSIVSVSRAPDPRAVGQFDAIADWWRVAKDGEFGLELKFRRETPPYETDNCVRCHKTLPIGVHPRKIYEFDRMGQLTPVVTTGEMGAAVPASAEAAVADLHKYLVASYRRAPVYDTSASDAIASPANYGPALGPEQERSPEFMQSCTRRHALTPGSIAKVAEKMNCARCHNGNAAVPGRLNVGLLNFPLATEKRVLPAKDSGAYPNIIRSHILNGIMPLRKSVSDPMLSRRERRALFDCLSTEYFRPATAAAPSSGLFVEWLKKDPVETP